MDFINENLITLLILLPAIGAVMTLLHQMFWKREEHLKWVTLFFTVVNFLVSLLLLGEKGIASSSGFFFEKYVPWIKAINTNYHVGVDGLSIWPRRCCLRLRSIRQGIARHQNDRAQNRHPRSEQ